jgi:hypothetical protein
MPLDESILGFSNRWYRAALETALPRRLSQDIEIRLITAPVFVATKLGYPPLYTPDGPLSPP